MQKILTHFCLVRSNMPEACPYMAITQLFVILRSDYTNCYGYDCSFCRLRIFNSCAPAIKS